MILFKAPSSKVGAFAINSINSVARISLYWFNSKYGGNI